MTLKDLLFGLFRRKAKTEVREVAEKLEDELLASLTEGMIKKEPGLSFEIYNSLYQLRYDRIQRYFEYDRMDLLSPEISAALDIYVAEILQSVHGNDYFNVYAKEPKEAEKVKNLLRFWIDNFEKKSKLNFSDLIRRLLKYGDIFLDLSVLKNKQNKNIGIAGFDFLPEYSVHRVFVKSGESMQERWIFFPKFLETYEETTRRISQEKQKSSITFGDLISPESPKKYQYSHYLFPFTPPVEKFVIDKIYFSNEKELEDWAKQKDAIVLKRLLHISIFPNVFYPFGTSILESLRLKWRQLNLLQAALLIYRIFYGVPRKIWKIELPPKLPPKDREKLLNDIIQSIRKTRTFAPTVGYDEVSRILGLIEDLFVPEAGNVKINVETLQEVKELENIEDILLITREIELGLKIPRYRLISFSKERMPTSTTITKEDARFFAHIVNLQRYIERGFYQMVKRHYEMLLEAEGASPEDYLRVSEILDNIKIEIPRPISPIEKDKADVLAARSKVFELIQNIIGDENLSFDAKISLAEKILGINIREFIKEVKK